MAVNEYVLDVDVKRSFSGRAPAFRRGDNGVLVFRVFDGGVEYNLNTVTKAELYHETSKGTQLKSDCTFITRNGKRLIRYQYEDIVMVELGFTQTLLVLYTGNDIVSIRPFNVLIYTDLRGGAGSYLELIQELQKAIEETIDKLNDTVKLTDKGVPNGVATLDGSGKIPRAQLPKEVDVYLDHANKSVTDIGGVHDFYVDEDGMGRYKTKFDDWQYIGFPDEAMTGGTLTLDASIVIVNGVATVTYTGIPTLASSKWAVGNREKIYFTTSGTSISNNKFNVANTGIHTLYYKDSNGVDYAKVFDVTLDMFNKPNVDIEITDGDVTVTIPSSVGVSVKKWAKGSQNITYFAYNGTIFTGNTFEVTEIGTYTIYVKTTGGLEYVYEFTVSQSMLKPLTPTIITTFNPSGSTTTKYNYYVNTTTSDPSNVSKIELGWSNGVNTEPTLYSQSSSSVLSNVDFNGSTATKTSKDMYLHSKITTKANEVIKNISNPFKWGYDLATATTTISSLSLGSIFVVDGYDNGHFILLEKNKYGGAYVLHVTGAIKRTWDSSQTWSNHDMMTGNTSTFNTSATTSIGYYLNNTYLSSLPTILKSNIISRTWNTAMVDSYEELNVTQIENIEKTTTINASVGLLSYSELTKYNNGSLLLNNAYGGTGIVTMTSVAPNALLYTGVITGSIGTPLYITSSSEDKYKNTYYQPSFILNNTTTVRKVTP